MGVRGILFVGTAVGDMGAQHDQGGPFLFFSGGFKGLVDSIGVVAVRYF